MLKKKDFVRELKGITAVIKAREDHTADELEKIGQDIPVRVLQDAGRFSAYVYEHNLSLLDTETLVAWILAQVRYLSDVRVSSGITYGEAGAFYETTRINTIILLRLNYILHECMVRVYEILERDGRLRFAPKKAYNAAEKVWDGYLSIRYRMTERSAFRTMLDHLRLACSAVWPLLESVYDTIRDNMIRLGCRDIELRARVTVVFLMARVAGHSFSHFFETVQRDSGVDFSACFANDSMAEMVGRFNDMCVSLGIKTEVDKFGYHRLADYDPEKYQRFMWAWKDYITALRNDDLMDDAARKAIGQNPEAQKEYEHILEEEQQRDMEENIGRLSEKFNVTRL